MSGTGYTSNAWLALLAALSPTVSKIVQNKALPDIDYYVGNMGTSRYADAINFCCEPSHNVVLARSLEMLHSNGIGLDTIGKYLVDLTRGRTTAGALSELFVYDWLDQNGISFEAQTDVPDDAVLNPLGCTLDGKLDGRDVYFDVKSFGFQEVMIERLRTRIEEACPGSWIAIEGSWDVSVETLAQLLSEPAFSKLLAEVQAGVTVRRGLLEFIKRARTPVQVSARFSDPYAMAEANASYAFQSAKQFTRHAPFVLFFAYHPWLGGNTLSTDFMGSTSIYTRSLARRTFMQFLNDNTPLLGMTKGKVSRLISAIGFLNISHIPLDGDTLEPAAAARLRLFVNPNATNPVPSLTLDAMRFERPGAVVLDDFRHDNY